MGYSAQTKTPLSGGFFSFLYFFHFTCHLITILPISPNVPTKTFSSPFYVADKRFEKKDAPKISRRAARRNDADVANAQLRWSKKERRNSNPFLQRKRPISDASLKRRDLAPCRQNGGAKRARRQSIRVKRRREGIARTLDNHRRRSTNSLAEL